MVSIRFIISLLLSSTLLHLRDSTAHVQGLGKVVDGKISGLVSMDGSSAFQNHDERYEIFQQQIHDHGSADSREEVEKRTKVSVGRKMILKGTTKLEENNGMDGGADSKSVVASPNYVGKRERRNLNKKYLRKSGRRGHHHHQYHDHRNVHVNFSGFIAFNADYHVARSHPPKNN